MPRMERSAWRSEEHTSQLHSPLSPAPRLSRSYLVEADTLGGGSQALIRVTATDGVNTSQDASDGTFSVEIGRTHVSTPFSPLPRPAPLPILSRGGGHAGGRQPGAHTRDCDRRRQHEPGCLGWNVQRGDRKNTRLNSILPSPPPRASPDLIAWRRTRWGEAARRSYA